MDKNTPKSSEITSEQVYQDRRKWIKGLAMVGTGLATTGLYKAFSPAVAQTNVEGSEPVATPKQTETGVVITKNQEILKPNNYQDITNYNNYYEFSTNKSAVVDLSSKWKRPEPWTIEIGGLVAKPRTIDMDLLKLLGDEERIYRFRCVEAWSMIIPWNGFSLSKLLQLVEPLASAKYVAFETYFDAKEMPSAKYGGLDFPYVEGLRLDEAMHPLTMMATGIYGKSLLNQNGAPIRLVVPWKYGFKSIKSIVRITLTEKEPKATWNNTNPREYGFYSNVNPEVDHPRWSQADERVIGSLGRKKTLMFNGYAEQVAHLYKGMDLKKYF